MQDAVGAIPPTASNDLLRSSPIVPLAATGDQGPRDLGFVSSTLHADTDEAAVLVGRTCTVEQLDRVAKHTGGRVLSTAASAEQVAGGVLNLGLALSGYGDVWILGTDPADHLDAMVDRLVTEVAEEDRRPQDEVRKYTRADRLAPDTDVPALLAAGEPVTDIRGAYLFGPKPPPTSQAASTTATVERDEQLIADKLADLRSRVNSREHPPKRRRSLVKGLLDQGDIGFFAGPPGEGKTAGAVELACTSATGRPFAGRRTRRVRVLFLAGEGEQATRDRIRAWEIANLGPDERIPFDQLRVLPGAEDLRNPRTVAAHAMVRLINELAPELVIVDTLNKYTAGINENDAGDVSAFVKVCDTIRRGPSTPTVAILHHTPKSGGDLRGSSVLRGAADFIFMFSKDGDEFDIATLKQRNRKEDPVGRFTMEQVDWTEPIDAEDLEPDDLDDDEFIVDGDDVARRVSSIRVLWDVFGPAAVGLPKRKEYSAKSGKSVSLRGGFDGLDESTLTPGRQMLAVVMALGGETGLTEPRALEAFRSLKSRNNSEHDARAAWDEARRALKFRRKGKSSTRDLVPREDTPWVSEPEVVAVANRLADHQNAAAGGVS
ncbi:AAA family ATPase [Rhodococcus sp. IEGM 1408]|uniref:AAA family ATPase n=1 Tax=Rhodococcus sp. IEGM 1408 TaxID=3082220 RepID=UPI00295525A7|nr:AAA family ATPase [Rhodococcus sp. IEGM 1408]MDV8000763.1 AAA family ATPase [Rhodococcus sp. IEGM 1408]